MSRSSVRIFHNPRCSKSRQALALLRERGIEPEVIEYLAHPPERGELLGLLARLDQAPAALLRTKEAAYGELNLPPEPSAEQVADAIVAHPILMERPVVVRGKRAVIARPPERLLALLD